MEESVTGKIYDGRLLRRLLAYIRPYWPAALAALILLQINALIAIVGPLLTKAAVDRYLVPTDVESVDLPFDDRLSADPSTGLAQLGAVYLAVILAGLVLQFVQHYLMQWTAQRAMFSLRMEIMQKLQRLDIAFYDRNPVGRLVTRVTTDVDTLSELFASGLVSIAADLCLLGFVIFAMFQLSPGLTLILLGAAPFVIAVTVLFRKTVSESYRRIRVAVAKINSYIQEHVSGIAVLQLFNAEERSIKEFDEVNEEHMAAYKNAIFAYGWFFPAIEFIGMVAVAGLLAYGGLKIERGELTLGVLLAFFQYGMRFFKPIQDLSEKYNILQSATAAAERIFALMDEKPAIATPSATPANRDVEPSSEPAVLTPADDDVLWPAAEHASTTPADDSAVRPAAEKTGTTSAAAIEFDGIWFAYKDEDWILRDVSFTINPGETVAVVGHTGAGKTTLMSLLLRFYDVQRGAIRIGGVDLRDLDPADLRRNFGVVLQDPHLFSGTIEGNIRLGTPWIEEEHLVTAAEQVNLMDFIQSLPEGFASEVRERGAGISTGQKQLISFARALAHDTRYLILDEATSSVDTETEEKLRDAVTRLVEGRTSIIIAHRLSTIQRADRILVMHHGELRESGTHAELLAQRGIYWKLYQLQYKDQEVGAA